MAVGRQQWAVDRWKKQFQITNSRFKIPDSNFGLCPLPPAYGIRLTYYGILHAACCIPLTAHSLLPTDYCLLTTPYCLRLHQ